MQIKILVLGFISLTFIKKSLGFDDDAYLSGWEDGMADSSFDDDLFDLDSRDIHDDVRAPGAQAYLEKGNYPTWYCNGCKNDFPATTYGTRTRAREARSPSGNGYGTGCEAATGRLEGEQYRYCSHSFNNGAPGGKTGKIKSMYSLRTDNNQR